jgi:tripartite-type tricarboxylate transporter receptor subunit TctC
MRQSMRWRAQLRIAGTLAALALSCIAARAGDYPSHPLRLLVPGAAGGGMDVMARLVAASISKTLNAPIVVENKPGAAGDIAINQLAHSPADGYTMALGQTSQLAINPTLYGNLPYDALKDFAPIVLLSEAPNVVVVSAKSPIKSVADLIAAAKKESEGLDLATPGVGTVSHLSAEMLQKAAGVKFRHIPYRGADTALTDTLAQRVPVMLSSIPTALALIQSGQLRALAVTARKRNPVLPDVPTMEEQGYPGFYAATWYGLLMPAGTPATIVQRVNAAANEALKSDAVVTRIAAEGGVVIGGSSDGFKARLETDNAKWSKIIKDAGIHMN